MMNNRSQQWLPGEDLLTEERVLSSSISLMASVEPILMSEDFFSIGVSATIAENLLEGSYPSLTQSGRISSLYINVLGQTIANC